MEAKVVLDPQRRKDTILTDAKQLAFAQGFELVEDQVLLDEVAGLVEWPVVLMGSFDPEFLSIPSRGDPRHDPQQPEMLCGERSQRVSPASGRETLPNNSSSPPTSKRRTAARPSSPATSA